MEKYEKIVGIFLFDVRVCFTFFSINVRSFFPQKKVNFGTMFKRKIIYRFKFIQVNQRFKLNILREFSQKTYTLFEQF